MCVALVCPAKRRSHGTPVNPLCSAKAGHKNDLDIHISSLTMCFLLQVGQRQGGLLHLLQSSLDRATAHVWFERSEVNDRLAVARRLREHIEDKEKLPILIFPEGKIHHQIFLRQRFSTSISYLTFSESKRIASSASEISCLMRSIFHGKTFSYIFHQKL